MNNLSAIRNASGIKKAEVSQYFNYAKGVISKFEASENLTENTIYKFAQYYKTQPHRLTDIDIDANIEAFAYAAYTIKAKTDKSLRMHYFNWLFDNIDNKEKCITLLYQLSGVAGTDIKCFSVLTGECKNYKDYIFMFLNKLIGA